MAPILSYRDLVVWQHSMNLIVEIYRITNDFPSAERFGLVSQMRRAAVSIPSNIAEGYARREGAYLNHVRIALGSQAELSTEIEAARRLGFLAPGAAKALERRINEICRMLYGLRASLERRHRPRQQPACSRSWPPSRTSPDVSGVGGPTRHEGPCPLTPVP